MLSCISLNVIVGLLANWLRPWRVGATWQNLSPHVNSHGVGFIIPKMAGELGPGYKCICPSYVQITPCWMAARPSYVQISPCRITAPPPSTLNCFLNVPRCNKIFRVNSLINGQSCFFPSALILIFTSCSDFSSGCDISVWCLDLSLFCILTFFAYFLTAKTSLTN